MKKMKNKWIKPRHKVFRKILYPLVGLYVKAKTGIKIEKFKGKDKGPYLVVYNHQTGYDQFIFPLSFSFPLYQVASDDIFSMGILSKIINYIAKPIPIKKNVSDITAVKTCIKVAKEGGSIALSPEGNRTYSGQTGHFNPAIVGLIKLLNLPVLIYRIEGGYNALPRWADKPRKGKVRAYVKNVIPQEQVASLSKEQLLQLLTQELHNNDYDLTENYTGKRKAEYLERVAYVCPKCGLSQFISHKNTITCQDCGLEVEYLDNKQLKCTNDEFSFKNYLEWYNYQNNFINNFDLFSQKDAYYREQCNLFKVIACKKKISLYKNCTIALYGDKIEVVSGDQSLIMPFEKVTGVSVLGRNKLNVYYEGSVYQVKSNKHFNAVKYLNFYHRYNNQTKENGSEFLGL